MAKCALYTPDQLKDGKPIAEGIPLDNELAVKRFLLRNADKLVSLQTESKEQPQEQPKPSAGREFKSVITKALSQANVSDATKKELLKRGIEYVPLKMDEAYKVSQSLIEEFGGAEAAMNIVRKVDDVEIAPAIKVMIAGGVRKIYAELADAATTDAERQLYADEEADVTAWLSDYGTGLGQGVRAFAHIYKESQWGLTNFYKKQIKKANKEASDAADEVTGDIKAVVDKAAQSVAKNLNETDIFDNAAQEIADLKKENEELRAKLKPKPQGTKKNPANIFKERAAKATGDLKNAYDLLTKPTKDALLANELGALIDVMEDQIKAGVTKSAELFDLLGEKLNPKFTEGFEEAYTKVKEKLVGFELDTAEQIAEAAANTNNEIAKKILANNAKIEAAQAAKKENANIDLAARIVKDAESLNFPKTKKQQDVLAKMLTELQKKAKDYYKTDKEKVGKSSAALLNLAGKNLADSKRIWDSAKGAVNAIIDAETTYTDDQKAQLKDFLQSYQDSIFDTLLSQNKASNVIKEALQAKGFVTENGSVDWRNIVGRAGTTAAAKQSIEDWVKENTDLTDAQIAPVIEQLFRRYDNIVKDKITAEIAKLMKKKSLGKGISPKIDRLIMLSEQGLLNTDAVKSVLAEQFGIINMTPDQEAEFKQLIKEYTNAPLGFIKALSGENLEGFLDRVVYGPRLQGTWDYIKGEATLALMNMPSVYTMRYYGYMTHLKNFSSIIDVFAETLMNAMQTRNINGLKVAIKEMSYGMAAFQTVLASGNVGTSASTSNELANVGRKFAVRTMEQRSAKFLGVTPDFFVNIGGKPRNINLLNVALKAEKYNPRLAEATDSFNWALISGSEQYKYLVYKAKQNDPSLSNKQANALAYKQMYGVDRELAKQQAKDEFAKMGKTPTRAELKRRALEIEVQNRSDESRVIAEIMADETTLKNRRPTGVISMIGFGAARLKSTVNVFIEDTYKNDPTRAKKAKLAVASLFANTVFPFVTGIANILERAAEFEAIYGASKATLYLRASAVEKDPQKKYILRQRSYKYAAKAVVAPMLMITIAAMIDADDDDDSYIAGSNTIGTQVPNTLRLFGLNIPLDAFGSLGIALAQYADVRNALIKEEQKTGVSIDWITPKAYKTKASTLLNVSFLQNAKNAFDMIKGDSNAFDNFAAGGTTNLIFPFAGTSRQLRNTFMRKDMERSGFYEKVLNNSGLYGSWMLDRPTIGMDGKEVNRGDRYPLTGDISSRKDKTELDKILEKRGIDKRYPLKADEEDAVTEARYPIITKDVRLRNMTLDEFNSFKRLALTTYDYEQLRYFKENKKFVETGDVEEIRKDLSKLRRMSIVYALYKKSVDFGDANLTDAKNYLDVLQQIKSLDAESKSGYQRDIFEVGSN